MKNEQWEAVHAVFEKMEELCGQLQSPPSSPHAEGPAPGSGGGTQAEEVVSSETESFDIVGVRAEIRKQLDFLRVKLAEEFSERACYLVLFPIVAYFDEHIKTRYLGETQLSWPPLQRELFQIENAGELFYETVDDLIRQPQTIPFIHEIYYFCLNKGFQGRYADNPVQINEYMRKLREKIPVADLASVDMPADTTGQIKPVGPLIWYYAGALVIIVVFYFLLRASSNYWDLGFARQDMERSNPTHQEESVRTETPAVSLQESPIHESTSQQAVARVTVRDPREEPQPMAETLEPESKTASESFEAPEDPPAADDDGAGQFVNKLVCIYTVQVSSFRNRQRALSHLQGLQERGFDAWITRVDLGERGVWHRVLLGKYKNRSEALANMNRLRETKEFQDSRQIAVYAEAFSGSEGGLN
jgi:type IV/VI secretion system ImpK/VasF family protein